ncbi:hypothetical protein BO70DRAFT_426140 [Aspergillus heteromorphus CBS 117.55]|uniref:Uncharacterized protein n=1 Tax=Aspergillus heteromorphus CBS 117.55 TaxID=1448321 RepID=A0A317WZ15_9EURO|nr:uncharacterized protein BO70DRAFT_426140 [Aspergillus heteromorphus CBS 117.55]PWY91255.1 hypothetical protein BO70DRAFT_426140 [Aspergillus heteromorphus CBS 117.55]
MSGTIVITGANSSSQDPRGPGGAGETDESLKRVTAVGINPGNLSDPRALRTNTPAAIRFMSRFIIQPFRPLLSLKDPTIRTSAEAAVDVVELAVNKTYAGETGFFTLLKKDDSSPESQDGEKQEKLWKKTLEWAKISPTDIALVGMTQPYGTQLPSTSTVAVRPTAKAFAPASNGFMTFAPHGGL